VYRLAWPVRFVAIILAGALLTTGVVLAVAPRLWRVANAHDELPVSLPDFQPLSQRSLVYDVFGNVIAVYERENSQPIQLAQVPTPFIDALLAVEDNEYYSHHGVNLRGFFRALLSNFASNAPTQGASTITQQVVKNEYLAGLPRDGRYKALQAHYATMLEKKLTKDQILERYLNTVYFGNNAYGLQAAAEVYFGKDAKDLTLVEGAFLAGLVRSPSGYDPIRNVEQSHRRFVQVVDRLKTVGLVTPFEATNLVENWQLPDRLRTTPTLSSTKDTYFTLALRDYLLTKSNILGATEQERATLLYRGGLRIHTTLDPFLQAQAEQARNIVPQNTVGFDAAIVSLDTTSGAIRVMVGGRGLRPNEPAGEVNMALVPRQTGSSIKAFILAAALEAGAQPNDIINGSDGCSMPNYENGKQSTLVIAGSATKWEVGPLNGKNTWSSTDCGFVRLSWSVGLNRVVDTVYRIAHSVYLYQGQPQTERQPFMPLLATATGNNVMAPIDMASGMQSITNQGLHHDPYYVEYIDKPDGTRYFSHVDPGLQVLDPAAANETVLTLKGVIRSGTGARNLKKFSRPATGKTGTQDNNTNAWFVGGTPQITTAVWVGDPNGYTEMNRIPEFRADTPNHSGKVQGADYPARIWGQYMEAAHANLPVVDWPAPPKYPRAPMRLYAPGEECLAKLVSGTLPPVGPTTSVVTTTTHVTTTVPGETTTIPPVTTVPRAVVVQIPSGTTIAPDNLDPHAPLPSVVTKTFVYVCDHPPPNVVVTKKKGT